MEGGRPLNIPLASMGISCRGAVIVRTSPRVDKGQNKKPEPHWSPGPLFMPSEFPRRTLLGFSVNRESSSPFSALIFVINLKGLSPPPPLVSSLQAGVTAWRPCQEARGFSVWE
jgi:hypothetical protein